MEVETPASKNTKRKTLGGFGLFHSNKPEKPPQEDMSHLPPQQRKRALAKMKKENEKDIDKVEHEITALKKVGRPNVSESGGIKIQNLKKNRDRY